MKKFLIVGNSNAITYKEIFPLIKDNEVWLGVSPRSMDFKLPSGVTNNVNACFFTNMEHEKRKNKIPLVCVYSSERYPKYDNYDAIEVNKVSEIPYDYKGVMAVPITFLEKYCPNQFRIVGQLNYGCYMDDNGWVGSCGKNMLSVDGKTVYKRILIRKK